MANSLLHLVFGGEISDTTGYDFVDPQALDIVGIFPSYAEAFTAWQGVSRRHIDEALIKYVIVHLHRTLDPDNPVTEFQDRRGD